MKDAGGNVQINANAKQKGIGLGGGGMKEKVRDCNYIPANTNNKHNFGGRLNEVVAIVARLATHADQVVLGRLVLLHILSGRLEDGLALLLQVLQSRQRDSQETTCHHAANKDAAVIQGSWCEKVLFQLSNLLAGSLCLGTIFSRFLGCGLLLKHGLRDGGSTCFGGHGNGFCGRQVILQLNRARLML